jgi:hypothetical protein
MVHQVVCQGCGKTFTAKRADARFHDTACRARSHRQRTELLEIHPIKTAFEAVLAFETRVLQAQQVGQDVGLLQAARRGALLGALAAIEADLAPWRESDPSGYESELMAARASAERVTRARCEAIAETLTLPETSTPESVQDSNTSTETNETLPETSTPESVQDSNTSTETNETLDTSEPKRAHRSRVRTTKTPRRSANDIEGLRAGLKAAIAAGLSQRVIALEIKASQSQISRFAAGQGLSENARNGLAEWLNEKRY